MLGNLSGPTLILIFGVLFIIGVVVTIVVIVKHTSKPTAPPSIEQEKQRAYQEGMRQAELQRAYEAGLNSVRTPPPSHETPNPR